MSRKSWASDKYARLVRELRERIRRHNEEAKRLQAEQKKAARGKLSKSKPPET